MRVIQINLAYKSGSTGKIVYEIKKRLDKENIENYVIYGRGKRLKEKNVFKIGINFFAKVNKLFCLLFGNPYGFAIFNTFLIKRKIKKINPNIVHIHCINGNFVNSYTLLKFLSKHKIKVVYTQHAEFLFTGGCPHSHNCNNWKNGCGNCRNKRSMESLFFDTSNNNCKRMHKALKKFEKDSLAIVSVSPWLLERSKQSYVLKDLNHYVIKNGIDTNIFKKISDDEINPQKENLNLNKNTKTILYITPNYMDPNKGGIYFDSIVKDFQAYNFIAVGSFPSNHYFPDNVTYLGSISDNSLMAKLYNIADTTLLTSERETFSMVVIESLCCGTPVVGFKAGGPESIALLNYASFVEYGNLDSVKKSLVHTLNTAINKNVISDESCKLYSSDIMTTNYLELYKKLL
ncbi:MAG: glycosyltransferase [Erysipelotrichales bacterium]|nr:glycosyltransferase [Erysipelotrichales bacterium]